MKTEDPPNKTHKKDLAYLGILLLAGLIAYANSFTASYHFDDFRNITCNPAVVNPHLILFPSDANLPASLVQELRLRPVGFLTFALNYRIGDFGTFGFHVFNFVIHCLNSFLIYFLVIAIFKTPEMLRPSLSNEKPAIDSRLESDADSRTIAFVTALLFIVHPVQTQAVTYIVQRFASLSTLFYIGSCLSYLIARKSGIRIFTSGSLRSTAIYAISVLLAFLAVKTKENTYTIPLAVTLIECFFFVSSFKKRLYLLMPFYLLLVLLPLSLNAAGGELPEAFTGGKVLTDMSRTDYLLTQFTAIMFYFRLILLPYGQNLDHDFPLRSGFSDPAVTASFLLIATIIFLAVIGWRKTGNGQGSPKIRLAAFGMLWFFVTNSAESGLVPIIDLVYEHRIYLPSAGFLMALASLALFLVSKCHSHRKLANNILVISFSAAAAVLIVATHCRNKVWEDEISLWEDCARKSPEKPRVLNTLGASYLDAERPDDASAVLEKALKCDPSYWAAHTNLSSCYELMARRARESGLHEQTILNLWGLSVMHGEAAAIIKDNEESRKMLLKKLLNDIDRVKTRLRSQPESSRRMAD